MMSQVFLAQMGVLRRRGKLLLEVVLFALLLALLERQYLAPQPENREVLIHKKAVPHQQQLKQLKQQQQQQQQDDESASLPTGPLEPPPIALPPRKPPPRHLTVKAIGHGPNSWYYGALKGKFDMCYRQGFVDPALQCRYLQPHESVSQADVVVFRGTHLDNPVAQRVMNGTEGPRPPQQWWVFFDNEPPYKVWKYANLSNYKAVFNLTATYSSDSDIPRVDMRRFKHCVRNPDTYRSLGGVDYTRKKRKGTAVAWLASECSTQSKREEYVKQLQRYIPVDVYGDCGPLKCGSRSLGTWAKDRCHERLLHNNNSYKFYLSFENSFCEDYVTEKLWLLEKMDILPVVMGAVDYANMMPKDSFIDVRDFDSPRDLAKYLQYLDTHNDAYNEYIRNKKSLDCYLTYPYMPWECALCRKVHALAGTRRVVYDLGHYWGSRKCLTPSQYFRKVPDYYFGD